LIDTNSDTWKAKRVRRGSPFIVWIGTRSGPAFIGKAEIVQDTAVQDMMLKEIPKKYFLARIGLVGPSRAKFDSGKAVTIRITPESDLPDGFQSQPGAPAPKLKHDKDTSLRSHVWPIEQFAALFAGKVLTNHTQESAVL
jgi:hypothetical protein